MGGGLELRNWGSSWQDTGAGAMGTWGEDLGEFKVSSFKN